MKPNHLPPDSNRASLRLAGILLLGCALLALLIILRPRAKSPSETQPGARSATAPMTVTHSGRGLDSRTARPDSAARPERSAEEIVAEKVGQFARQREELVAAMAKHFNVAVPSEVNRFFAAAQAGNWSQTSNLFVALKQLRGTENWPPGLEKLWPAILETYGAAEQVQLWPAQQLLNYGNAVLDSLHPGMIYVGGNDAGRFIPTLLTDTSGGEPHIVLTQNALADATYLDYVRFRYGDKLNALSADDSQNSFQTYLADAQKRMQHDLDFPNEPKQLRPGEDVRLTEGRVQVSGQVAVMAINEQLLQTLLQKNPDATFALTESFPLKLFYGEATTLGPVTELRAGNSADALTPERAAQSLDYWRSTTQTLLAETEAASAPRDAYAKLILGQANLFEDRKLSAAVEQAYQLATSLSPGNPEGVLSYVKLLTDQKRYDEARQLVQTAIAVAPDNQTFHTVLTDLNKLK
ncbi:MAG: tetratricopeptide repeat protein [Verrucomicrobiota bacterium]